MWQGKASLSSGTQDNQGTPRSGRERESKAQEGGWNDTWEFHSPQESHRQPLYVLCPLAETLPLSSTSIKSALPRRSVRRVP